MVRKLVAIVVVLVSLSACGSSRSHADGGDVTNTSLRRTAERSDAALPAGMVDILGPDGRRTQAYLGFAESTLLQRCMDAAGFNLAVEPYSDQAVDEAYRKSLESHTPLTVEAARSDGYGITNAGWPPSPDVQVADASTTANMKTFNALSAIEKRSWQSAMYGPLDDAGNPIEHITFEIPGIQSISVASKGCYADARVQLYGDLNDWLKGEATSSGIPAEISATTESDPSVVSASAGWKDCMAAAGITAEDRATANNQAFLAVSSATSAAAALEAEKKIATQDALCATESSYFSTYQSVWSAVSERVLAAHAGDIQAYKELLSDSKQRAEDAVN
jgi:hypothetical protein